MHRIFYFFSFSDAVINFCLLSSHIIMGQVLSTENDVSQLKEAVGSVLYDAMLEGDAVPDLGVVHPLLLASQDESINPGCHLQEQLRHVNRFFFL